MNFSALLGLNLLGRRSFSLNDGNSYVMGVEFK